MRRSWTPCLALALLCIADLAHAQNNQNAYQTTWSALDPADDWAALLASGVIAYNGVHLLRPALHDLMDRKPDGTIVGAVERAARAVHGVLDVEKLNVRRAGTVYHVDIHVQAAPKTPLDEAHMLGGMVKGAIRREVPAVDGVLVHMEPFEH